MNNNKGMIVYKENFITRIKKFFKYIFRKQEIMSYTEQQQTNIEITNEKDKNTGKDTFNEEIKVVIKNNDTVLEKDNFLRQIEGNRGALNLLSLDRLRKLEQYYDDIIEKNDNLIKKLKANA